MINENAETIRIDVDSTQFEACMASITEAVKNLRETIGSLGEEISSAFERTVDIPNKIENLELFSDYFDDILEDIHENPKEFNIFETMIPETVDAVNGLKEHMPSFWEYLRLSLEKQFPSLMQGLTGMITNISSVFNGIGAILGGSSIAWIAAIGAVIVIIALLVQNFDTIKAACISIWEEHLKPLWDQMSLFLASVGENLRIIWESLLKPVIDWVLSIFEPVVMAVIEVVMSAMSNIVAFLSGIISAVMKILDGVIQFVAGVFSGDWQRAWDGVAKIIEGVFGYVVTIIKGMINKSIYYLNVLIAAIYSVVAGIVNGLGGIVEAVGNMVGKDWGFSLPSAPPQIPYLAQGAVLPANRPFLAVVGDQRHGTNVEAPLSTIQAAVAEVMARQGTGDINITFTGDLAQLGRVLKPVIERENRRVGGSLAKGVY